MQNFSADDLHRTTVYDRDGVKVGKVQQVYLDDDSGRPSWVTVTTGFFGTNESLIPLDGAEVNVDVLKVPFDKQVINDAPNFDPGHHMDESDENALYDYYGMGGQAHDDRNPADRVSDRSDGDRGADDQDAFRSGARTGIDTDREDSRSGQAGAAFSGGADSRESRSGDVAQSSASDSDRGTDDQERELLDRERDLLRRERELLDKDRRFIERERQQGGRARLRRHDRSQADTPER